jgi:hypothetical protein
MFHARQFQRFLVTSILFHCGMSTTTLGGNPVTYDPVKGGVPVLQRADGGPTQPFIVEAKGRDEVEGVLAIVTGVLFQASAVPDPALNSPSIDGLSYKLKGLDDAVLCVTIDGNEVTSDVPAWIWAVAAKFADQEGTAAVTLDNAPSTGAVYFPTQRWRKSDGVDRRLLWVRCHPAIDDTLMSFFLIAGDAMMTDSEFVRSMTEGLQGIDLPANSQTSRDQTKGPRAAQILDTLIRSEAQPDDCVMLNDVDETYVFSVVKGRLQLSGHPNYHFSRKTSGGKYQEVSGLTGLCARNRGLLYEINPQVYHTLDDFSRMAAFFTYIDDTNPQQLDEFVAGLQPVLDRLPEFSTPAAIAVPAR